MIGSLVRGSLGCVVRIFRIPNIPTLGYSEITRCHSSARDYFGRELRRTYSKASRHEPEPSEAGEAPVLYILTLVRSVVFALPGRAPRFGRLSTLMGVFVRSARARII